jgi:phage/plasmid-like protein (TIGR03299 family)
MPANIAQTGGRYNAMYVGAPPWHGLGEMRDQPQTAEEAQRGVSDFVVDKAPLVAVIDGQPVEVPDQMATYRTDTKAVLGVVSKDYRVIQNLTPMQMLMEIVRTKEAGIVAHAALGRGERLFAVLDLKALGDLRIPGDPSKFDPYIVAQWWHDGTGALSFGPSAVRVDCQNMANAQLAYAEGKGLLVRIVHVGETGAAVEEARKVLGYAEQSIESYMKLMTQLADIAVPEPEKAWLDGFLEQLIPIPPEMERTGTRDQAREAIASLYAGSSTLVGVPHTLYRVKQSVDEYADHFRPLRVGELELVPARRFTSSVDGPAARLKADALRLIREEFEVR